ncbi:MAG: hypothetical protein Q9168_002409 [Polycauliona sp. 1 TL-2023]
MASTASAADSLDPITAAQARLTGVRVSDCHRAALDFTSDTEEVDLPSFYQEASSRQHPWANIGDRTFWSGPRPPQRHWRNIFRWRSRPSLPSNNQTGNFSQRTALQPLAPKASRLSMPTPHHVYEHNGGSSPCLELPGHTEDPPSELAAFEQGTYQEVQKEMTATVREMAIRLRQKQTIQQLERLQFDDPEIIRLRRVPPGEMAELDSEPPGPAELPGWEVRALSSEPGPSAYELDTKGDIHNPEQGWPGDSQMEAPFSDLELVADVDSRGHLELPTSNPPNPKVSQGAQDIRPQGLSYVPSEGEAALRNCDGHSTECDSSTSRQNREMRSNYAADLTNRTPTDASLRQRHHPSPPQAHSRNLSGSVTMPIRDGEHECLSLFTDLDILVKALPARKSCRRTR